MGAQHVTGSPAPQQASSALFEHDLAAILGDWDTPPRRGRSSKIILTIWPIAILMGAGLIALIQHSKQSAPVVGISSSTILRHEPTMSQAESRKAVDLSLPRAMLAKAVESGIRPTLPIARHKAMPAHADKPQRNLVSVSYQMPSETAFFARAPPPAEKIKQDNEERDNSGTLEINKEKERERVARLEAQDAVRTLRLR